jgi:6-phosphogluconolactonase (cycloisomerase 2 family)
MSYNLEWRPVGGATTSVTGITDLFYDLTGLTSGTDYEFRVQEDDGTASDYSAWNEFTTASAKDIVGDATVNVTSNATMSFTNVANIKSIVGYTTVNVTSNATITYNDIGVNYAFGGPDTIVAADIDTATYDSVSFSVSSQDTSPANITFKPDGTKMYVIGSASDLVHQYTLSTAWDLDTASYDSVSFDVSSEDASPMGVAFKPDGTKMYVVGNVSDSVHQYTLSTAWDLDTASYDSVSFSVSSQEGGPR